MTITPIVFIVLAVVVFANRPAETVAFEGAWFGEPITDLFSISNSIDSKHVTKNNNGRSERSALEGVGYTKAAESGSPNVILLIVDALRADHVGAYGYNRPTTPFIDSLITDGKALKVDNGFSSCAESICSIVSVLSGRRRSEFSHSNVNLNAVLKANGYNVQFLLSADHSWSGLNTYYPPYDYYFDGKSASDGVQYDLTDDRAVIDELRRVKENDSPTFFYLHLMSAHLSSARKGEFIKFRPYENSSNWYYKLPFLNGGDTSGRQLKINRYDNGVVEADYRVREIFSILSSKGYLDNAIIWIVSDHGEAFDEHGHYGHGKSLYQEELSIPMVVVDSNLDFYKNTSVATQVDIAPTIIDRLGIDVPAEWNGRSLNKLENEERITWHEIPSRKSTEAALISKPGEYIYKAMFKRKPTISIEQIFELYSDVDESNNLVDTATGRELVERLQKKIGSSF
ncbi:MAG: sulfatase-like hydrolase/transferase [Pseudomonadales bacterium]